MARIPRSLIIDEAGVGIYHCVQRCVRRAMLCGRDPVSGEDYEHRKVWIRGRLEFLAGQFAIDVLGYSVLGSHFHVLLRNRPDIVRGWSDDEVARRWWNLFPQRKDGDGPAEPEEHELAMLKADPDALAEKRRRLASISWLMRSLAEPIARRANREDGCTGRFFEGRYKCQRLLDDAAVLACSVYVDLNPIRAGVAQTPEESQFTSVYDRVQARQATPNASADEDHPRRREAEPALGEKSPDAWLSPVELDPRCDEKSEKQPSGRASNRGFLPLEFDAYLELVDWTGRQSRPDKRGQIPCHLRPILERLRISEDLWVDTVTRFGRMFHRAAGRKESLSEEAAAGWPASGRAARSLAKGGVLSSIRHAGQ